MFWKMDKTKKKVKLCSFNFNAHAHICLLFLQHYEGDVTLKTACFVRQQEAGDEDCGIVEDWAIQSPAGLSAPLAVASYTVQ